MQKLYALLILLVFSSSALAQTEGAESTWQLSLDVIKEKASNLVAINQQLMAEQQDLLTGRDKIKNALIQAAQANSESEEFLKKRNGKTDQQIELEEITSNLQESKQRLAAAKQSLEDSKKDAQDLERKITIKKLKLSDWEIQKKAKEEEIVLKKKALEASIPSDFEINNLRKEIEKQKAAEASLEAKINELSKAATTKEIDVEALRKSNDALRQQAEVYQKEVRFRKDRSKDQNSNTGQFAVLKAQKKTLEDKIKQYEMRIDALKNPSNMSLTWDKEKKRLIHQMVQADAGNQQLKSKIDNLKEDINVLRDQVAKLERRINFSKGKN